MILFQLRPSVRLPAETLGAKGMPFPKPADYPFWFRGLLIVILLLLTINIFFFLAPLVALAEWAKNNVSITAKELLGGLGTLAATFIGAWLAFYFAKIQRTREKEDREASAGNRALFTLYTMHNSQLQYQSEVVVPYRNRDDAWLNLHVSTPLNKDVLFDTKDLSFVLDAHAPTFAQVLIEEARYRLAAYLVEEHRRIQLTEAWPRLQAAGVSLGDNRPAGEIEQIIGVGTVKALRVTTAAIIKNFDENVISSLLAFRALRARLLSIYPKHKFFDIGPAALTAGTTDVREFERAVWKIDRIRLIIRAPLSTRVEPFDWQQEANKGNSVAQYIRARVASRIGGLQAVVTDGNGGIADDQTKLRKVRASYGHKALLRALVRR
jgi:hypothetical protein